MIAVYLAGVVVVLVVLKILDNGRKRGQPPMAGGSLPILGHSWLGFVKREHLHETLMESLLRPSVLKQEGTVGIQLGTWNLRVCLDPDDSYLMLNSCLIKDPLYRFFIPLFGGEKGLITADIPTWKIHRKLLNPTFNQSVLDSYLIEFNEQSRQLVKLLAQEVDKGQFNQFAYLKQTVLQIICATMMGVSVDDDKDIIEEYGKSVQIFTSCMVERIRKFYYHSDIIFNMSNLKKKQDVAVTTIHYLTNKVLQNKKAKISAQEDNKTDAPAPRFKSFLDMLLELGKEGALTDSEIQQEVTTFIGAAFDTTYHTLGLVLLNIGSYPEVQRKIAEELGTVLGDSARDVERQDVSNLKYLEAVIKETMRLYPVVALIGRTLDKDVQFKKSTLQAGSRCLTSIYHVGRHHSWGADAAKFRPERWFESSLPSAKAFAVFGLGRRSCIGSNFAMTLMKTVLSHVLRAYHVTGDVTRLVQYIDVVVTPVSGHHVALQRREC